MQRWIEVVANKLYLFGFSKNRQSPAAWRPVSLQQLLSSKLLNLKKMRLSFVILLLGGAHFLYSQATVTATVSGEISEAPGTALPYANVMLYKMADSTLVKAGVSDENGNFEIETVLQSGKYFLRASMVGFETAGSPAFLLDETQPRYHLGAFHLSPVATALGEVTVVARKPFIERKTDRLIVNVENSIVGAGSSALEVLERSPGVFISSNDNISLRGKSGVIVMIDGKITPMSGQELANMLRGMPSDNIERVELITNPSAKYDAAGNAGIIDIRLKKDKRYGTNGTISANLGQGVYHKAGAGVNINHCNQKINVFGSYNYSDRLNFNKLNLVREFFEAGQSIGAYDQRNFLLHPFKFHSGRVGLDFFSGKKTIFGAVLGGSWNAFNPNGENTSDVLNGNGEKISAFTTGNQSQDRRRSYTANFNFKHTLDDKGKELTADADYMFFGSNSEQLFTTNYYDLNGASILPAYLLSGDLLGDLQIRSFKADYVNPLKNNAKWEAGMKTSLVTADNDAQFFDVSNPDAPLFDTTKSNHFLYRENLNAAYLNASKEWEKFNIQIGLRAEQTRIEGEQLVTGETLDTTYLNLFSSAFFNIKISKNYETGLNLSRRLDRPSYQQLNPFKFFLDPSTFRAGNPYLRPQYTWAFEWANTLLEKYTATLSFSRTLDNITEVIAPVEGQERVTVQTDKNLARYDYVGLSLNAPIEIAKWWSSVNDVQVYRGHYTGNLANTNLANGNVVVSLNTNNNFRFKNNWSAELGCWYRTRMVYGFMNLDPQWALNVGIQKSFLDRRATVRINVTDIFWTSPPSAVITFRDYVEHFDVKRETRTINISLSWRYGSNQVAQARRRTGGAEEERRRASQGQG